MPGKISCKFKVWRDMTSFVFWVELSNVLEQILSIFADGFV
nr:hypothetical protein [Helicoverpa armigera nucleopolyhedrovirus]